MAGVAAAVEHDLVAFELETLGGQLGEVAGAGMNIEDPIAGAATEMVVMVFASELVAAWLARQLDLVQPAFVEQGSDVAVDGGDAEARDAVLSGGENFTRPNRTVDFGDHFADGGALASFALDARHPSHYSPFATLPKSGGR